MNPFELITDDHVILEMCQSWPTETLLNMAEAYHRVGIVCQEIIQYKKKILEIENLIFQLITKSHGLKLRELSDLDLSYIKITDQFEVVVKIMIRYDELRIYQLIAKISETADSAIVPKILPDIRGLASDRTRVVEINLQNQTKISQTIKQLATNLVDQEYQLKTL